MQIQHFVEKVNLQVNGLKVQSWKSKYVWKLKISLKMMLKLKRSIWVLLRKDKWSIIVLYWYSLNNCLNWKEGLTPWKRWIK